MKVVSYFDGIKISVSNEEVKIEELPFLQAIIICVLISVFGILVDFCFKGFSYEYFIILGLFLGFFRLASYEHVLFCRQDNEWHVKRVETNIVLGKKNEHNLGTWSEILLYYEKTMIASDTFDESFYILNEVGVRIKLIKMSLSKRVMEDFASCIEDMQLIGFRIKNNGTNYNGNFMLWEK